MVNSRRLLLGCLLTALTSVSSVPAAAVPDGLFITVQNPITSTVYNQVKAKTERFLERTDRRGARIVYDFNPDGNPAGTAEYGPCRDLAQFLRGLHGVKTIAFVRNEVSKHTVLPVFACSDIVMAPDVKIGDILRDQNVPLDKDQIQFYETIANSQGRCPALILKMADPDMEIVEGTKGGGTWYIDKRREKEEAAQGFVGIKSVLAPGSPGVYSTGAAQRFGLCALVRGTRQELAVAYQLPPISLREDPLEGRTPVAWRMVVSGTITPAMSETIKRRIRKAIAQKANLILLQLECGGGDPQDAIELAEFLRTLKDDKGQYPVMSVAYVTDTAHDTALFLALGASEIVIGSRAKLGEFEEMLRKNPNYGGAIKRVLGELAREQGYPQLVIQGMIDKNIEVYQVRSKVGPRERGFVDAKTLDDDKKGAQRWVDEGLVKRAGVLLNLEAERARELGIARHVVDGTPKEAWPKILTMYGLERVQDGSQDWLDDFADFLRRPAVSLFLVMIGIIGLILEMKLPGLGVPGVTAAICFVLFFWAQSKLAGGQLVMLSVLLFLLGLVLIAVEIFIIPGFGVTGFSGIALVIFSLALATMVKKPETSQEWLDFGTTMSMFGSILIVAVCGASALIYYAPNIPYLNRVFLAAPKSTLDMDLDEATANGPTALHLLGAIGESATVLRPAGMAKFDDQYVDVVAEGSFVPQGVKVQVIEVEGNRIVVKQV